jgi:hypothetical protein
MDDILENLILFASVFPDGEPPNPGGSAREKAYDPRLYYTHSHHQLSEDRSTGRSLEYRTQYQPRDQTNYQISSSSSSCSSGMAPTNLDTLPTELIQNIASHTSPQTVLALSRVNHTIRNASYDSMVFLALFQDQTWAKKNLDVRKDDVEFIARYALAEATPLSFWSNQENEERWNAQILEGLRYLPSMAVLGNIPKATRREDATDNTLGYLQRNLGIGEFSKPFHLHTNGRLHRFALYVACCLFEGEFPHAIPFQFTVHLHSFQPT